MAVSTEQLLVKIGADISDLKNGFADAKSEMGSFGKTAKTLAATMGVAFGAREVFNFFRSTVRASSEAEQATVKLSSALKAQGDTTSVTRERALALSSALQSQTAFDDEAITGAQTLLIQLGRLRGEGLEKATKATLDLAAGLGIDLQTAAGMVGKAAAGNTQLFSRYGLVMKTTGDKSKDFENVLAKIEGRFAGAAAAQVNTYAGSVSQLTNAFDDFQEIVGGPVKDQLQTLTSFWGEQITMLNRYLTSLGEVQGATTNLAAEENKILKILLQGGEAWTALTNEQKQNAVSTTGLSLEQLKLAGSNDEVAIAIRSVMLRNSELLKQQKAMAGEKPPPPPVEEAREYIGALSDLQIQLAATSAAQSVFGVEQNASAEMMRIGLANTLETIKELQAAQADKAASDAFIEQKRAETQAIQEQAALAEQGLNTLGAAMLDVGLSGGDMQTRVTSALEGIGASAANMLVQFLINKAIERLISVTTARASIQADAARAGAGAVAATAGIPVLGPALAPAAGASAFATAAAYQALVGFAHGGIVGGSLGQGDPNVIRANRGEEVLRRDDPRHAFNGGGRGGANVTINVATDVSRSDAEIAIVIRKTMKRALEDLHSSGELFAGAA